MIHGVTEGDCEVIRRPCACGLEAVGAVVSGQRIECAAERRRRARDEWREPAYDPEPDRGAQLLSVVMRRGRFSMSARPFHARLTRCAATSVFLGERASSQY